MDSSQLIINIFFGIITFLAGWVLKITFGMFTRLQTDYKEMYEQLSDKNRRTQQDLVTLALSIPEKYLRKDDFVNFADRMDERFDKIDEKLDRLNK